MPAICFKNNLQYTEIPDALNLTNIEKQLIVKSLIFIKIRQLPKTRMLAMNDRVINVPIEDDDIIKHAASLPRTVKNSGMVTVAMKRKLTMKNIHKKGWIRPEKIYEALVYLKENHPEYKDINITDCEEWLNSSIDKEDETDDGSESISDDEDANDTSENSTENEAGENMFNSETCLLPEEPLDDVIGKSLSKFV